MEPIYTTTWQKPQTAVCAGLTEHVRKIMNIPWSIYVDLIVRYFSIQCDKYIGKISTSAYYVKTCVSHLITCAAAVKKAETAILVATDLHGASNRMDTGDGCLGSHLVIPDGSKRCNYFWWF